MLSIGELSRVTKLTVKTIRLYHERGLLPPSYVDPDTGYRYYDRRSVERARIIVALKRLQFPLADIGEMLATCDDDADAVSFFNSQRQRIHQQMERLRKVERSLDAIIRMQEEAKMQGLITEVTEKIVEPFWVVGIRAPGRYSDCGERFGRLARAAGRHAAGKPFNLYYEKDYKEEEADFETCFPLKKRIEPKGTGVEVHELPGGRGLSLIHQGSYEELGRSYEKLFTYLRKRQLEPLLPLREIYLKGPGLIFPGNPKKYITELLFMVNG